MSIINAIPKQRQQLLDGIEANEGDINLGIFEDFYPDQAHFIYELLQNAEDAGATEVSFELTPHGCSFEHNGTRHFNESDIRGITGIFNSSKKDQKDKIGKFGVGFKSVFVYTESPIIYSKEYSFKIIKLVLPQEIPPKPSLGLRTRFEFPFNNPKKNIKTAYIDIKNGLEKLSDTTLLFLNSLQDIKWRIDATEGVMQGNVVRKNHTNAHIEILKIVNNNEIISSHWLRFSKPVRNLAQQQAAIAYELELTTEAKCFDKNKNLAEQFKIIPAKKGGKVSIFFPAEKENSGLRFHIHAPFIPELSRASIKNSPENLPLFEQIAAVAANALHSIRDFGLLTGEFLVVLPNNYEGLPEQYLVIRTAIINKMRSEPLVPTYRGGHLPSTKLLQSRAALKTLLSVDDLAFITGRNDNPDWAIGANQKNSNQDRFLSSLFIQDFDVKNLQFFLQKHLTNINADEKNRKTLNWIASKSFEWMQHLYALLLKQCEEAHDFESLEEVFFIRLTSGKWGKGSISYFQFGSSTEFNYHRVDDRVFTAGTNKTQQQDARKFLEKIGVRVPNEIDDLFSLLNLRYKEDALPPTDEQYLVDLKQMIDFMKIYPGDQTIAQLNPKIFKISDSEKLVSASNIYLDEPYEKTGLHCLQKIISNEENKRWSLSSWYLNCGISLKELTEFAKNIGCQSSFNKLFVEIKCENNPSWDYLKKAPGKRISDNSINRDFDLSTEVKLLIESKNIEAINIFWNELCRVANKKISGNYYSIFAPKNILEACYQITEKGGPHYADSQFVHALRNINWVPQIDGTFVKPSEADASKLPKGFVFDRGYKWLEAVQFGSKEKQIAVETATRAAQRKELGFDSEEELKRALEFKKLPVDAQKRILADLNNDKLKKEQVERPERPVRNPELRNQRMMEEAQGTPEKVAVTRERSVQLGASEAKAAAKVYLQDQYTNQHKQMICQICKDELPFRLPTGAYYFEAVEMIADSAKRHRATYLALCPNHAAAYQYANGQRSSMDERVATASSNEIDIDLAGQETTIYFTQMHLADAKACLEADQEID
ncbi:MAG: hypothetical protein K2Y10_06245 [Burkholderiaceae bacterium]|nr:hypothetical protein [Burkholderiaceae bacterium]